jgi:bifunctional non-homologous end joining protein LigD
MARALETLEEYRKKRDFAVTPEPPAKAMGPAGRRFVVQRHWARREHFDLRLELNGVMLSWAVARGPSANPADKRLAVRTENHPIAYADFEGTIPQGQYGGGTVMIWDRGEWIAHDRDPARAVADGKLKLEFRGERLKGGYVMIRMQKRDARRQNWLLIKERDGFAEETDGDLPSEFTTSIASGRSRAQISAVKQAPVAKKPARRIAITHGERVVFPAAGVTKADIAAYYERVADRIWPYLKGRPLSLVRVPESVEKETFFQRHAPAGMRQGIVAVPDPDGEHADFIALSGPEGLRSCAQFGVVELHGWGSRMPKLDRPDRLVLDLDPDKEVAFSAVKDAARRLRDRLAGLGLQSFPLLSGGKGVHVVVPLDASQDWQMVSGFAERLAKDLAKSDPKHFTATASKARRRGKIYIDWLRNKLSASAIVPWSLRARPKASVAVPVTWHELQDAEAADRYTIKDLPAKDGWAGYLDIKQEIPR